MSSLLIRSISLDILIGEFYVESHLMCFPASLPSDCHHRLELASLVPCRRFRLEVIKGFMPGLWRPRTMLPSADPRDGRCEAKPVTSPYNNPSCTICRLKSFFNFIACTSHDIASHRIDIARHTHRRILCRLRAPYVFSSFTAVRSPSTFRASFVGAISPNPPRGH
jgi:hypothetical protein